MTLAEKYYYNIKQGELQESSSGNLDDAVVKDGTNTLGGGGKKRRKDPHTMCYLGFYRDTQIIDDQIPSLTSQYQYNIHF